MDTVYAPELLPEHFNAKCLQLLVHSGSRGLGQAVLRAHVDRFGHAGLPENTKSMAVKIILQSDSETLTDEAVEPIVAKLIAAAETVGAKLR